MAMRRSALPSHVIVKARRLGYLMRRVIALGVYGVLNVGDGTNVCYYSSSSALHPMENSKNLVFPAITKGLRRCVCWTDRRKRAGRRADGRVTRWWWAERARDRRGLARRAERSEPPEQPDPERSGGMRPHNPTTGQSTPRRKGSTQQTGTKERWPMRAREQRRLNLFMG